MNLHQLNVAFDPVQDRLLLRASTTDAQEFRFWLTRRMVAKLWPRLIESLQAEAAPQAAAVARPEFLEFRHAEAIQQSDLSTPYSSAPKTLALGDEPLLANQLSLHQLNAQRYELILGTATGTRVNLVLPTPVLHGLLKLLQDAAKNAQWALDLTLPATPVASSLLN